MNKLDANKKLRMVSLNTFYVTKGVKQGCPLSHTLFGLCIDKLEEVVNRVAKEEELDAPKLMQQVILLL